MATSSVVFDIPKITILFPPGDQLTSLLISKESDTVIQDLLQRLCTLRAIEWDLKKLAILNDVGEDVDLTMTVGQSKLVFIEIVDKKELKKEKKKVKETFTNRGLPAGVSLVVGQCCYLPLDAQLFDDEKKSLAEFKQKNAELCQHFSDEYVISCLFARKMDHTRSLELLANSWNWRMENGFVTIPKLQDIQKDMLKTEFTILGARDKAGRCIRYIELGWQPNVFPHTVQETKRMFAWYFFVGIFAEGIDALRNGNHGVVNLAQMGWKQFDLDFQKQTAPLWANTFPLLVRRGSILNAPPFVNAMFKIFRTFLKGKVVDRLKTVKDTKNLLKVIDKDQLWKEKGGEVEWSPEKYIALMTEWCEKNEDRLGVE